MFLRIPFVASVGTAAHNFRDKNRHGQFNVKFDDVSDGSKLDVAEGMISVSSSAGYKIQDNERTREKDGALVWEEG